MHITQLPTIDKYLYRLVPFALIVLLVRYFQKFIGILWIPYIVLLRFNNLGFLLFSVSLKPWDVYENTLLPSYVSECKNSALMLPWFEFKTITTYKLTSKDGIPLYKRYISLKKFNPPLIYGILDHRKYPWNFSLTHLEGISIWSIRYNQ